jgi:hypothetical protein
MIDCCLLALLNEITFQFGPDGFRNTNQERHYQKERILMSLSLMKYTDKYSLEYVWLWVAIEQENKRILGFSISKERNMLIAERFVSILVKTFGPHPISTDCERTWYTSQACHFLKVDHHLHSFYPKELSKERCNT